MERLLFLHYMPFQFCAIPWCHMVNIFWELFDVFSLPAECLSSVWLVLQSLGNSLSFLYALLWTQNLNDNLYRFCLFCCRNRNLQFRVRNHYVLVLEKSHWFTKKFFYISFEYVIKVFHGFPSK